MLHLNVHVDPVWTKACRDSYVSIQVPSESSLADLIQLAVKEAKIHDHPRSYGERPSRMIAVNGCGDYLDDTTASLEDYAFEPYSHLYVVKQFDNYYYTLNINSDEHQRNDRIHVPGNVPLIYLKRIRGKTTGVNRNEWKLIFAGKQL